MKLLRRNIRANSMSTMKMDNLKEKLKDFVISTSKKRNKHWYQRPDVRQFWDDEQEHMESDWADVFFDLIFVAMAFKLGKQISHDIKNLDIHYSLLFFFAQYLPMYAVWYRRTNYIARFTSDSLFHDLLSIVENVLVAFMTFFIGSSTEIFHNPQKSGIEDSEYFTGINLLFGFCICRSLLAVLYMFKYYELRFSPDNFHHSRRKRRKIQKMTSFALLQQSITLLSTLISAALAFSNYIQLSLGLLIFSYFFTSFLLNFIVRKPPAVPLNVPFVVKRFGEFSMLMLGEGVLQIIINGFSSTNSSEDEDLSIKDTTSEIVAFGLAYLILSSMEIVQFYALPYEANEHVLMRKTNRWSIAVALVMAIKPLFYGSLIWVGIALAKTIEFGGAFEKKPEKIKKFEWLLVISLVVSMTLLVLQKMLHLGPWRLLFGKEAKKLGSDYRSWKNLRVSRVIFFGIFLCYPLFFLLLPGFGIASVEGFLFACFLVLFLFFGLSFWEKIVLGSTDAEIEILANKEFPEEDFSNGLPKIKEEDELFFEPGEFTIERKVSTLEEFSEKMDRKKEKLGHMLSYLRSHADYLRTGIDRATLKGYDRGKMQNLLDEVSQLRQLTEIIEDNLGSLFPDIRNLRTQDTLETTSALDEDEEISSRPQNRSPNLNNYNSMRGPVVTSNIVELSIENSDVENAETSESTTSKEE
eukprot:maker-scaffold_16-snap-gene-3.15-mRNA-1 protein AED:0.23 eAED:0.23 QI:49/1/1/1/1/1/2/126/693